MFSVRRTCAIGRLPGATCAVLVLLTCLGCQPSATPVPAQSSPVGAPSVVASATYAAASTAPTAPQVASTAATSPPVVVPSAARGVASPGAVNLFVFNSADGSLSVMDPASGGVRVVLKGSAKNFYDAPSFSPDGSRIVYVFTNFDDAGKVTDEIRSVKIDGSDVRTLFKSPVPGPTLYFGYPHYSQDGASLTFSIIIEGATPRENRFQTVRGPAAGGSWKVILENGYEPAFSPDEKKFVFLQANPATFFTSLWTANADGSSAQQLVAEDIFLEVAGPHYAPDGQTIVFTGSGPPARKLPASDQPPLPAGAPRAQADSDGCALWLLFGCLVSRAYANGLPWELWQVSVDGKHFKQLTSLSLDSPWPAYSRNGHYIAFMTFEGTFQVERASGKVNQLSKEGGHGVIDWYQR